MKPMDAEGSVDEALRIGIEACDNSAGWIVNASGTRTHNKNPNDPYIEAATVLARLRVDVQEIAKRLDGIAAHGYSTDDMLYDLRCLVRLSPASGEQESKKKEV